jgi:hypothetical protein
MSAFGGKADMTLCGNPLLRSLLGAKRTSLFAAHMFAFDPKRTSLVAAHMSANDPKRTSLLRRKMSARDLAITAHIS